MRAFIRNRPDLVSVLSTLLVGSVLVVGVKAGWPNACDQQQIDAQAHPDPTLGSDAVSVQVLSSSNKDGVMREMACRFEATSPTVGEHQIDIWINAEASGEAYQSIKSFEPTVWSPAAKSWVNMLRHSHGSWIPEDVPSIATSPQVIAVPEPLATAMGWPDTQIGWSDIIDYASDPAAWTAATHGAAEGAFKLGMTNPRLSTSGLNSTVAAFAVASNPSNPSASNLSLADVSDEHVLGVVRSVESATVHYAPTSVDFLRNLRTQDEQGNGGRYVSAILLEEKSVWDYNHGNPSGDPATLGQSSPPTTKLVAFYPTEGAIVADHPYAILQADWVTADQQNAAQQFLDFLLEGPQQDRFKALGFRGADGSTGDEIDPDNGLLPDQPSKEMQPPDGEVLQTIRETWPSYRKQARMLILFDVSGSMASSPTSGSPSKLELAKAAAVRALAQLAPTDKVGLWTFSSAAPDEPYTKVVPIRSHNGAALESAIDGLQVEPGNASQLYTTVQEAAKEMYEHFDAKRINGIVLLCDGPNDGSATTDPGPMLAALAPRGLDEEVRVFTIAYGDGAADVSGLLTDIANASLGTAYDAKDAGQIAKVFPQVVANF